MKNIISQSIFFRSRVFPETTNKSITKTLNTIDNGLTLVFIGINGEVVILIENRRMIDVILFRFIFIKVLAEVVVVFVKI